ncbi:uncharacterized protein LOC144641167 [Oculina patagonica]
MAAIQNKIENDVVELREELESMSVNMRLFSLSMRSLYVENAVGTNAAAAHKFRQLRDDTRNDAMVYLKGVLPLSTKFVSAISEYFEYYEALTFEEWSEMIRDIHEEVVNYKKLCVTLLKMHDEMLVTLKERGDQAKIIVTELKDLQEEFEKKKMELEATAESRYRWAFVLFWIPVIGQIAAPLLATNAKSCLADSVAKGKQAQIQEAAAFTVNQSLIPAIEAFIDGIKKAAGFFSIMEEELCKFEGKAEKSIEEPKRFHYIVMNKEARDMKHSCQSFYAVLPDVRTDFLAIPTEGTDGNYVDRWLEKQKQIIQDNCGVGKLATNLLRAITGGN